MCVTLKINISDIYNPPRHDLVHAGVVLLKNVPCMHIEGSVVPSVQIGVFHMLLIYTDIHTQYGVVHIH